MTIRRMKTYAGGQGYVYQYYFVGQRQTEAGTQFIFDVTSDRKTTYAVSVLLPDDVTQAWASKHNRRLTDAERYGAVKMRLFQAFDDIENMLADGRKLTVEADSLEQLLGILGVA